MSKFKIFLITILVISTRAIGTDLQPAVRQIGPAETNTPIGKALSVIKTSNEPLHNQGLNVSQEEVGVLPSGQDTNNATTPSPTNSNSANEQMTATSNADDSQQAPLESTYGLYCRRTEHHPEQYKHTDHPSEAF